MLQHLIEAQNAMVEAKNHLLNALSEDQNPDVLYVLVSLKEIIGSEEYQDTWGTVSLETIITRLENTLRD